MSIKITSSTVRKIIENPLVATRIVTYDRKYLIAEGVEI